MRLFNRGWIIGLSHRPFFLKNFYYGVQNSHICEQLLVGSQIREYFNCLIINYFVFLLAEYKC